jgi:triacylglycerol lipase
MPKQPAVVLIHGLFGFRRLLWLEYFQGVRQLYEGMGLRVIVPSLPWADSIRQRAHALAEQLESEPAPLHLLAHSMGGLDARLWINNMGGSAKTSSLTTLSTPHRGSPASDHVCRTYSPFRLFAGARGLTTEAIKQFNLNTPDHPKVIYRSYSASRPIAEQPWIVRRYGRIIQQSEGDNDSQVSVRSAAWGKHVGTLPCDHFEIISRDFWFNPFKSRSTFHPLPIYRQIGEWILAQSESILI